MISFLFRGDMDNQDDIHSFECDNCENGAAHYHCKTCDGHLCKDCKMTHESKRLTRGHTVILLSEYSEGNGVKKDQCTYEIRGKFKEEKEEIEDYLLPFFKGSQEEGEKTKKFLSDKVSQVKHKIEEHYSKIVERFESLKNKAIAQLEEEEKEASMGIDKTINEMKSNISLLASRVNTANDFLENNEDLHENMCNEIKEEKVTPKQFPYIRVNEFLPGNLNPCCLQQVFGKLPSVTLNEMKRPSFNTMLK